jgi:hypothetical protein
VGSFPGAYCFECSGPIPFYLTTWDTDSGIKNNFILISSGGKIVRVINGPNGALNLQGIVWDGRDDQGNILPPGDYYLEFVTGNGSGMTAAYQAWFTILLPTPTPTITPTTGGGWIALPIVPTVTVTPIPPIKLITPTPGPSRTPTPVGGAAGGSTPDGVSGAISRIDPNLTLPTGLLMLLASMAIVGIGVAKQEELGAALAALASLYKAPEKPAPPPVPDVAPPPPPPPPLPQPPSEELRRAHGWFSIVADGFRLANPDAPSAPSTPSGGAGGSGGSAGGGNTAPPQTITVDTHGWVKPAHYMEDDEGNPITKVWGVTGTTQVANPAYKAWVMQAYPPIPGWQGTAEQWYEEEGKYAVQAPPPPYLPGQIAAEQAGNAAELKFLQDLQAQANASRPMPQGSVTPPPPLDPKWEAMEGAAAIRQNQAITPEKTAQIEAEVKADLIQLLEDKHWDASQLRNAEQVIKTADSLGIDNWELADLKQQLKEQRAASQPWWENVGDWWQETVANPITTQFNNSNLNLILNEPYTPSNQPFLSVETILQGLGQLWQENPSKAIVVGLSLSVYLPFLMPSLFVQAGMSALGQLPPVKAASAEANRFVQEHPMLARALNVLGNEWQSVQGAGAQLLDDNTFGLFHNLFDWDSQGYFFQQGRQMGRDLAMLQAGAELVLGGGISFGESLSMIAGGCSVLAFAGTPIAGGGCVAASVAVAIAGAAVGVHGGALTGYLQLNRITPSGSGGASLGSEDFKEVDWRKGFEGDKVAELGNSKAGEIFEFKTGEREFATQVLKECPNCQVYRVNQAAKAGDFLIIDETGKGWILELKSSGATAGNQLNNAASAAYAFKIDNFTTKIISPDATTIPEFLAMLTGK